MKVFKFGGASVKDPQAVRNVSEILNLYQGEKRIVVISAMGKTTNALEEVAQAIWDGNEEQLTKKMTQLREFHAEILADLFPSSSNAVYAQVERIFVELESRFPILERRSAEFEYDQIVSLGEVISTTIVAAFLIDQGHSAAWSDARKLIRTNHRYQEAEIDWTVTEKLIRKDFLPTFDDVDIQVTQGFIGHTTDGLVTTLGREGSDFTAGIFAYCTDAESVTIWKDVPGMLNADPKYFDDTIKLDQISFREAIELAYYGASVIHPKTIKPLQNKGIPLFVKSFIHPTEPGTIIQQSGIKDHLIPSFIFKMNQLLVSFTPKDFSFIVEENLSDIFNRLARANAKINLMQNSAVSFSVLLDRNKIDLPQLLGLFENNYVVKFNDDLELVTIRHYDQATIDRVTINKEIVLEQKTRQTARFVLKSISL